MSVSSPVRESMRLSDDKTKMVSPTDSSGRLDIPGGLIALRKDLKSDGNNDEVRKELEMFNLKELMLIHLDYIQQQSEVSQNKDKRIADLEHQVETLKQRLHRMTRRVSLNNSRASSVTTPNGHSKPSAPASAEPGAPCHKSVGPQEVSLPHFGPGSPIPLLRRKRQQSSVDGPVPSDDQPSKKVNKLCSKKHGPGSRARRSRTTSESSRPEGADRSYLNRFRHIWTTPETYATIVGETECGQKWAGSSAADDAGKQIVQQNSKAVLEVPKWRIHTYSPIYAMEGTEHLSDDVYERKHNRLASDEKRRKRWDVQRIREQRTVERLREREEARRKARDDHAGAVETNSFWPEPSELSERLAVCVADEVPIGFCGIDLPQPSKEEPEFILPWKNEGCDQCLLKPKRRGKR